MVVGTKHQLGNTNTQNDDTCLTINGTGLIPVTIYGTDSYRVRRINKRTLTLNGLSVAKRQNGKVRCIRKDVNGDGHDDLICRFEDDLELYQPINLCEMPTPRLNFRGRLKPGVPLKGTSADIRLHDQPMPTSGPMEQGTCGLNAICTPSAIDRECTCRPGYQSVPNQLYCDDIDECALEVDDCNGDTEVCWNVWGSYHCGPKLDITYQGTIVESRTKSTFACDTRRTPFDVSKSQWWQLSLQAGIEYTIQVNRIHCALDPIAFLYEGIVTSSTLFADHRLSDAIESDNEIDVTCGPDGDPQFVITPMTNQEEYSLAVNNFLSEVCPEEGGYEYEIVITPTPQRHK